jgi:hypothetical protein
MSIRGNMIARGLHDWEEEMCKILFGLALAAVVVNPASAQDHRKNFHACAKETGMWRDTAYTHKLQDGRVAVRYRANGQAQQTAFHDCLVRKGNSAKGVSR